MVLIWVVPPSSRCRHIDDWATTVDVQRATTAMRIQETTLRFSDPNHLIEQPKKYIERARADFFFTKEMIDAYEIEVSVKNLSLLSFRVTFLLGIIFFQGLQWIETCVPNLNFKSLLTYNANFWNLRSFSSFCSDNQKSDTQTCWHTWQLIRFPGSQMVRTWLDAVVFL